MQCFHIIYNELNNHYASVVSLMKLFSFLGTCTFDEEGAKSAILDVIQEFICGENPEETLNRLRAENNVSSVCGRVFKCGEPTYSCRECSMDPTCVLCSNCFKKSSHRMHKYKMATSSGGGCCDCGDQEAWKKDYCCEDHLVSITAFIILAKYCNIFF